MPSVHGILETAVYVAELARGAAFYKRVFDFATLFENERLIALDVAKCNVLLLFPTDGTSTSVTTPGGMIPPHGPGGAGHFAFSIAADDVESWKAHLATCGIEIESEVRWEEGASSIYFRDLDRNLVELMTPGFWANCRSANS